MAWEMGMALDWDFWEVGRRIVHVILMTGESCGILSSRIEFFQSRNELQKASSFARSSYILQHIHCTSPKSRERHCHQLMLRSDDADWFGS